MSQDDQPDPPPAPPPPANPWATPATWSAPTAPPSGQWPPQQYQSSGALPPLRPVVTKRRAPGQIYWGLGQVWLGLGVAIGLNLVVSIAALIIWIAAHPAALTPGNSSILTQQILNDLTSSPWFVLASLVTLWAGFLLGIFVASYGYGQRSLRLDFGWRFVWRTDVLYGMGLAIVLRGADFAYNVFLNAIGVDTKAVDNSAPIVDQKGIGLILVVLAASFGAPIVEELFFRGLTLRALQKRWGAVVGIIGSSVLFGILHAQPTSTGAFGLQSLWLVAFTASLGAVFAWVAVRTQRLGITVIAHVTFNFSALVIALLLK